MPEPTDDLNELMKDLKPGDLSHAAGYRIRIDGETYGDWVRIPPASDIDAIVAVLTVLIGGLRRTAEKVGGRVEDVRIMVGAHRLPALPPGMVDDPVEGA